MALRRYFTMQISDIEGEPTMGMHHMIMDRETPKSAQFVWEYDAVAHDGHPYELAECETCNALGLLSAAFLQLMSASKCEHSLLHFLLHADAVKRWAEQAIPRPVGL